MGIQNYNEQLAQINKAKKISDILKNYAKSTNQIIVSLNGAWIGGEEKVLFLSSLGNCVRLSVDLANDYDTFYRNAKKWLDEMNLLDTITKGLISYHEYNLTVAQGEKSNGGWIDLNTDTLLGYANKIQTSKFALQDGYLMANALNTGIDELISSRFTRRYSASNMRIKYIELQTENDSLADKLRKVSELFDKADKETKQSLGEKDIIDVASGKIVSEIFFTLKSALADGSIDKTDIQSLSVAFKQSNVLEQVKKDLIKKYDKDTATVLEVMELLSEHKYNDAFEKIGDKMVDIVYEDSTPGINLKSDVDVANLKGKVVIKSVSVCLDKDGYIEKNDEKYKKMLMESIKDGNVLQSVTGFAGYFLQTVGRAVIDIPCQIVDDTIGSIPVVGDTLDYTNAILEDVTGYSPELCFNEFTQKISNGVDWAIDGVIEGAGEVDQLGKTVLKTTGNVVVETAENIGSGVNKLGQWINSAWKG